MARLNTKPTIRTTNKSGHAAYSMDDKSKLVTQVLTSFFNEKKFYGDNSAEMQETIKAVIHNDPHFVSNLAMFARREFNMRTVSHVLTAYLAHEVEGKSFARDTVKGVTLRGDDVTEIMAFYLSTFGKPVPNALKHGIGDALADFDEYTLAKYKGDKDAVKMRDLFRICRPKPKDDAQAALWKKVIDKTLATPMTWETELSAHGNNKETWERLIDSGKVGYMALLRNLRNIVQANPSNIEKVWEKIKNPEAVRRSRQLPFRYLSAYKAVADLTGSRAFDVLETAVDVSVDNIPKLPGTTVIAVDVSGSMNWKISEKSDVRCVEIGMMLGLIANKICKNAIFYTFNDHLTVMPFSHRSGVIHTALCATGDNGTYMNLPFQKMIDDNVQADRIILLSDNECNGWAGRSTMQSLVDKYRTKTGKNLWVHAIDLQGYGTQQFCGARTNIIAGWSEKMFDFIPLAEQGEGTLVKRIAEYAPCRAYNQAAVQL